jgi:ribosomal-protein-alanine N-acetyltransferase
MILQLTNTSEADALLGIFSNDEIIRYTNFRKFTDVLSLTSFLERFLSINKDEPLQYGPYSIYLEGKIIGLCGAQQHDLTEGVTELWYILHKDNWGKGLAKKAISLILAECKANPQLKTVYAEAVKSNPASWNILEDFGFERTGEIAEGFKKEDVTGDLLQYAYECRR